MTSDLNPQASQMADESMVRNLAAQVDAIWPQERLLFERYDIADDAHILDAGCGTGEMTARLAARFSRAQVLGVDVLEQMVRLARARCAGFGARVTIEERSIYGLELPSDRFDLTVCRHVLQSIPHVDRALAELVRVTRPGGRLHLLAEDYGMIHFPRRRLDPSELWATAPAEFGAATGCDLFVGRNVHAILRALGLTQITVDFVVVDTVRVARETFAAIWTAWRDGYVDAIGQHTKVSRERAKEHFDDMIATIRDPDAYAVWHVPVVSAIVPG